MSTTTETRASKSPVRPAPALAFRILLVAAALALWFWTQSLLGARTPPPGGIGDALHDWTAPANLYFHQNPRAANALLIASSAGIDALGVFLIGGWLVGGSIRPFLGLVLLMAVRQLMQTLCALPAPPGMVWNDPGFPSLFVTYHVTNDFFFSGHTAIAVLGAIELSRLGRTWLAALGLAVVAFEVATLVVLRAHYTMDIFTGFLAAVLAAHVSAKISHWVDARLSLPGRPR